MRHTKDTEITSTLLREAKNLYYKQQLSENQGDPKKQLKILNSLLGKTGKDKSNVELHPPCMDIPSKLNEHFLLNYYDNDCTNVNYRNYLKNAPEFSMYTAPTDSFEVERVINSLNTNTPGYDDIPPLVLKRSSELITIPLTHIINLSLSNGYFPEQLKQAKVLPIFKSGDRFDMNNYRPISILPAFSNFFEKIISSRLIAYLENNNLLIKQQHGFRSNHSTESAILNLVSNVYKNAWKKNFLL